MDGIKHTQDFNDRLLRLQPRMLNFALILTSDRDSAYNLLQDSTLSALDHAGEYDESADFERWARNVMRSVYMARYHTAAVKNVARRVAFNISEDASEVPAGAYTVQEITLRINSLDEPLRRVATLWVKGFTSREISSYLHLERTIVGKLLRRLRF